MTKAGRPANSLELHGARSEGHPSETAVPLCRTGPPPWHYTASAEPAEAESSQTHNAAAHTQEARRALAIPDGAFGRPRPQQHPTGFRHSHHEQTEPRTE